MADSMTFPNTFDEFAEQYKIVDKHEVYTNGTELIPIFRVKQWLDHKAHDLYKGFIKELTEENESWQKALITTKEKADKAYCDLACEVEDLRAENERLKNICESYMLQYGTATDKEAFLKGERADTVRKMHSLIKERCIKGGIYPAFVESTIEKVTKELLGK